MLDIKYTVLKPFTIKELMDEHSLSYGAALNVLLLQDDKTVLSPIDITPAFINLAKTLPLEFMSKYNHTLLDLLICYEYIEASRPILSNNAFFDGVIYCAQLEDREWHCCVYNKLYDALVNAEKPNITYSTSMVRTLLKVIGKSAVTAENSAYLSLTIDELAKE